MKQSETAYQELSRRIVQQEVSPGSPLREIEVAESLGLSRTPVREALQRLVRDGLAMTVRRSVFVSQLTVRDAVDLYQLREAIEPYATALCARQPAPVFREISLELAAIDVDQMSETDPHGSVDRYYGLLARLDEAILTNCRNLQIAAVLDQAWRRAYRIRLTARQRLDRAPAALLEHRAICDAVANGDENGAVERTVEHLHASFSAALSDLMAADSNAGFEALAALQPPPPRSSSTIYARTADIMIELATEGKSR